MDRAAVIDSVGRDNAINAPVPRDSGRQYFPEGRGWCESMVDGGVRGLYTF